MPFLSDTYEGSCHDKRITDQTAYPLPEGLSDTTVQRIVVRNGFTRDLAASFLADLKKEVAYLDALTSPMPTEKHKEAFHH